MDTPKTTLAEWKAMIPEPPYGLVFIDRDLCLTADVDGCEVVVDDPRQLERLDTASLVVVTRDHLRTLEAAAVSAGRSGTVYPPGRHPRLRGTAGYPCEGCDQTDKGATLSHSWYRCNACGYPGQ